MSDTYETVLRDLLKHEKSSQKLAQNLIERITTGSPRHEELNAFLSYLVHAGYKKAAIQIMASRFRDQQSFAISTFCYILHQSGYKPGSDFLTHLKSANTEFKTNDRITHFLPWEKYDSDFSNLKSQHVDKLKREQVDRKSRWLEKLEYLRNNRMIEEEKKLLHELAELYPDENIVKQSQKDLAERWARAILARHAVQDLEPIGNDSTLPREEATEHETQIVECIFRETQKLVLKKSHLAYDFAMLFYFLGFYEQALQVLDKAPENLSTDWFQIQLLLDCKRPIEALDAIAHIEIKYANDPETTFGAAYLRSIALHSIGQKSKAIELLKSIVQIRPHYRSAHSLLMKWGNQT